MATPDSPGIWIESRVLYLISQAGVPGINLVSTASVKGNIFARDTPEVFDKDPSPCCIVVVGNDNIPVDSTDPTRAIKTNSTWNFVYPVLVLLAKQSAQTAKLSDPWKKNARHAIKNVLSRSLLLGMGDGVDPTKSVQITTLTGNSYLVPGIVTRVKYEPEPVFSTVGFAQGYKATAQCFYYRTEEPRAC